MEMEPSLEIETILCTRILPHYNDIHRYCICKVTKRMLTDYRSFYLCGLAGINPIGVVQVIRDILTLRRALAGLPRPVGFVPTMGALHAGHLSLIRRARKDNPTVVVSIYLNPTQFNQPEDLETYPSDLQRDLTLLQDEKVDVVFAPSHEEMYPAGFQVDRRWWPGRLAEVLEGRFRPGHFEGVITIVRRLFEAVRPDRAYFGQKDYQQWRIIERMAGDLFPGLQVIGLPTVRDDDGLALSSRNVRLSPQGRRRAALLPKALSQAREAIEADVPIPQAVQQARQMLEAAGVQVEYLEAVDPLTLEPVVEGNCLLCAAVYVEGVRLIDNVLVEK